MLNRDGAKSDRRGLPPACTQPRGARLHVAVRSVSTGTPRALNATSDPAWRPGRSRTLPSVSAQRRGRRSARRSPARGLPHVSASGSAMGASRVTGGPEHGRRRRTERAASASARRSDGAALARSSCKRRDGAGYPSSSSDSAASRARSCARASSVVGRGLSSDSRSTRCRRSSRAGWVAAWISFSFSIDTWV